MHNLPGATKHHHENIFEHEFSTANANVVQHLHAQLHYEISSKCSSIITGNAKELGSKVDQVHIRSHKKKLNQQELETQTSTSLQWYFYTCPTHEPSWTQGWKKNNIFVSTFIHQFPQKNGCPASLESGLLRVISLPHSGEALERLENCRKNNRALPAFQHAKYFSMSSILVTSFQQPFLILSTRYHWPPWHSQLPLESR